MKSAKYLVLSVFVITLASCAAVPVTDKNLPVPAIAAHWSASGKSSDTVPTKVRDGWLKDLKVTALSHFVAEVLKNNPGFQAQLHRMKAAGFNARIARGNLYPAINAGFGDSRRSIKNPFIPSNNLSLGLDVRWEIDVWGRLSAQSGAAEENYVVARSDLAGARLSLAAQVAKRWFDVMEARDQVALAHKTVRSFERSVSIARARFNRGLSSGLDLRLIISNLEDARARLSQRQDQLGQQKRRLEILAGRYPAAKIIATGKIPDLTKNIPAGLPVSLLERRPDLQAAKAKLLAAGYNSQAADKALLPRFSFSANANNAATGFDSILKFQNIFWNLLFNMTQPVFQGGKLHYAAKAKRELFEAAKLDFANTVLTAFREVEDTLASEGALKEQEQHTRIAAEKAVNAEKVALDQYSRGLIKVSVLLQSRQSLVQQSKLLLVKRQRINNRITLYLALGGDFATKKDIAETTSKIRASKADTNRGKTL
ncbi:MAG: efflux transporter outer membrane subunit [Alphaproteobacteria bacterium]|nr:efflux transporter outer membrane subunit [Alphaproteobacteria bacterium]